MFKHHWIELVLDSLDYKEKNKSHDPPFLRLSWNWCCFVTRKQICYLKTKKRYRLILRGILGYIIKKSKTIILIQQTYVTNEQGMSSMTQMSNLFIKKSFSPVKKMSWVIHGLPGNFVTKKTKKGHSIRPLQRRYFFNVLIRRKRQ